MFAALLQEIHHSVAVLLPAGPECRCQHLIDLSFMECFPDQSISTPSYVPGVYTAKPLCARTPPPSSLIWAQGSRRQHISAPRESRKKQELLIIVPCKAVGWIQTVCFPHDGIREPGREEGRPPPLPGPSALSESNYVQ